LFLPVMEDSVLAERNVERSLSLEGLLLYSAVCGSGLDTIPLPGSISVDELATMILDLSTLALVLDKPLTARLVPIPGSEEGDMTNFGSPYWANTKVMATKGLTSKRILNRREIV
jgi:uncharacterized protein